MKKPTKKQMLAARALFRPKHKELPEQCVSCPFRKGNDKEFQAIVDKLAAANGEANPAPLTVVRATIRMDATRVGEFICHHTAYDADMELKDRSHRRQCPGATAWYKSHTPFPGDE
jgi:hypothetical protein